MRCAMLHDFGRPYFEGTAAESGSERRAEINAAVAASQCAPRAIIGVVSPEHAYVRCELRGPLGHLAHCGNTGCCRLGTGALEPITDSARKPHGGASSGECQLCMDLVSATLW